MTKKMFEFMTKTWNPVKGCRHNCIYCWACDLANGKLKHTLKYADGFEPKFIADELNRSFKAGDFIFVVDMGDLFGRWVPSEWIKSVLDRIRILKEASFLLMTKNPARYLDFNIPDNCVCGATVESDIEWHVGCAPLPTSRLRVMTFPFSRKFISIEPILDFNLNYFVQMLKRVQPEFVAVGYDNYKHQLPEPALEKTQELIEQLSKFTKVYTKTLRERYGNKQGS